MKDNNSRNIGYVVDFLFKIARKLKSGKQILHSKKIIYSSELINLLAKKFDYYFYDNVMVLKDKKYPLVIHEVTYIDNVLTFKSERKYPYHGKYRRNKK